MNKQQLMSEILAAFEVPGGVRPGPRNPEPGQDQKEREGYKPVPLAHWQPVEPMDPELLEAYRQMLLREQQSKTPDWAKEPTEQELQWD